MHKTKWLLALVALIAVGVMAGCGSGSSTTTDEVTGTVSGPGGSATATVTNTSVSGATPDDVYQACLDAVSGTAAESAGQTACAQARDAFSQCMTQAQNAPEGSAQSAALKACQEAANKATESLNSAP
jgi:hypothetical protein